MLCTFVLSPSAKQDLQDIMWYKAEYDPEYAIAFVDKLVDRFKQTLSTFPSSVFSVSCSLIRMIIRSQYSKSSLNLQWLHNDRVLVLETVTARKTVEI